MGVEITNVHASFEENLRYVDKFIAGAMQEERDKPFDNAYDINNLAIVEPKHEQKPLVSVLLASFNHEKYVEAAVRSVMQQKGVLFELIVIDDGSSDNSPKILAKLSNELKFRYIHRENRGLIATLNELLQLSRGKYFCTFASDDIMPQNRLERQSLYMQSNPSAVACFGQIVHMSEDGLIDSHIDKAYAKAVPKITFEDFFLAKKPLHGCAEMFVAECVKKIGGYDTRFFIEDFPLYLKILHEYGAQPVLEDVICCYYRSHGNNLHLNHNKMYAEFLRILELYKSNKLYAKAVKNVKANWFSALAYSQKLEAIKMLPKLASVSFPFIKRFPKLFIPTKFLKR